MGYQRRTMIILLTVFVAVIAITMALIERTAYKKGYQDCSGSPTVKPKPKPSPADSVEFFIDHSEIK